MTVTILGTQHFFLSFHGLLCNLATWLLLSLKPKPKIANSSAIMLPSLSTSLTQ